MANKTDIDTSGWKCMRLISGGNNDECNDWKYEYDENRKHMLKESVRFYNIWQSLVNVNFCDTTEAFRHNVIGSYTKTTVSAGLAAWVSFSERYNVHVVMYNVKTMEKILDTRKLLVNEENCPYLHKAVIHVYMDEQRTTIADDSRITGNLNQVCKLVDQRDIVDTKNRCDYQCALNVKQV